MLVSAIIYQLGLTKFCRLSNWRRDVSLFSFGNKQRRNCPFDSILNLGIYNTKLIYDFLNNNFLLFKIDG